MLHVWFWFAFLVYRDVLSHNEEAGKAAVQPHFPTGLLAATQHFLSASSPRPIRRGTQW